MSGSPDGIGWMESGWVGILTWEVLSTSRKREERKVVREDCHFKVSRTRCERGYLDLL